MNHHKAQDISHYSQLPLNGHLVKADTSLKRTRGAGPSRTSSPSKVDTSVRRTVGDGPERVRLRGS